MIFKIARRGNIRKYEVKKNAGKNGFRWGEARKKKRGKTV